MEDRKRVRKKLTDRQFWEAGELFGRMVQNVRDARPHREQVKCYCIDNVPASTPSDRDDGIYVEKTENGHRVYVTIADVAAHIPLRSALSHAACERAFTIYGPMIDSMFPRILEHKLSLEHRHDRLGLTVVMDIDEEGRLAHTELKRTVVTPMNCNYVGAIDKLDNELHDHHDDFTHMFGLAEKLRRRYPLQSDILAKLGREERIYPMYYEQGDKKYEGATNAMKTVETYMLLANHAAATLFQKASLPFIYRNFGAHTQDGKFAEYGTTWLGHDKLEKTGFSPYCHFTSPIRRGADYFNAHMAHYVIDQMEVVEEALAEHVEDRNALHYALWDHASEIMQSLSNEIRSENEIRKTLQTVTDALGIKAKHALPMIAKALMQNPLPITHDGMNGFVDGINQCTLDNRKVRREENLDSIYTRFSGRSMETLEQAKFSSYLRVAAKLGRINDALFNEMMARINHVKDSENYPVRSAFEQKLNVTEDAYQILAGAHEDCLGDPRWVEIKKAMLGLIKHNPSYINSIILRATQPAGAGRDELKGALADCSFHMASISLPKEEGTEKPPREDYIPAALYIMHDEQGRDMAAPHYSINESGNFAAAKQHALYCFLENYALGQLIEPNQANIPNLLYAEVKRELRKETVQRICRESGLKWEAEHLPEEWPDKDGHYHYRLSVSGSALSEEILVEGIGRNEQEAEQSAYGHMLRNISFMGKSSYMSAEDLRIISPKAELENAKVRQAIQNYELTMEQAKGSNPQGNFIARLAIAMPDGEVQSFEAYGSKVVTAEDNVCTAAIETLNLRESEEEMTRAKVRSHVMDIRDEINNASETVR